MEIQTPPAVTDGQYGKLEDVARDLVRKHKVNGTEFQFVLGHPGFASRFGAIINELANEHRRTLPLIERPPFLMIRVGTLKTEEDFRQALSQTDPICNISKWAGDIMSKPDFSAAIPQVEEDVEFVYASNEELGYPNGCTRLQTYEAGLKLGWKLCLPSDGPEIRRHYLNQPLGEWLLVAMEPIKGSDGSLKVFRVGRRGGGAWLGGDYGNPAFVWGASNRWLFRRK
jgi:hypothetical protein